MPTQALLSPSARTLSPRNRTIAVGVVAFHVAALWAMLSSLRQQPEDIVPAEIVAEFLEPAPSAPPAPPVAQPSKLSRAPAAPPAPSKAVALPAKMAAETTPAPLAVAPTEAPAELSALAPKASNTPTSAGNTNNSHAPVETPPPKIELPSSNADYLNNPKPPYPVMSRRLNEQGKVVVRVWIDAEGQASQASIKTSSGFERLDEASLNTVLKWRYVPGKRGGIAEGMWFDVPMHWVLR